MPFRRNNPTLLEPSFPFEHSLAVIQATYGDQVYFKPKRLNKFGRNFAVGTSFETVAEFQGTVGNETFVSTNLIDAAVSSNAADTMTITVEGHTIDASGNLTFVVQDVTLTGTTPVALSTPLARATRAFIKPSGTFDSPQSLPAGEIRIYDDTDGQTGGTPTTAEATKIVVSAGESQSEKCATATSQIDYWVLTYFSAGVGIAGAASVDRIVCRMETRDIVNGGVFRPMGIDIVIVPGQNELYFPLDPPLIVPKNHDWRVIAATNSNTAEVFAEAGGYLATIAGRT